jgi:hypothetical protein
MNEKELKEYNSKVKKNKIFYAYTDFTTLQNIGYYWKTQFLRYLPQSAWIEKAGAMQVLLWAFNIKFPIWIFIVFLILKYYIMMFGDWLIGRYAIKVGVYSVQNQYNSKKEHISPFNAELVATLEEICKKLEIKSKFTDL